jgi:hypothetical protein
MAVINAHIDPEQYARNLQLELLENQFKVWGSDKVTPLDMCDPWAAARYLGIEVQEGWLSSQYTPAGFKLGGFINQTLGLIAVDIDLHYLTKRFTLAHELGHMEMHPMLHHHREIPLRGLTEPHVPTDPREREANKFAGYFLVPTKQLRKAFTACFSVESLKLTDDVAWELLRDSWPHLMNSAYHSPAFERCVARAQRFRGKE